MLFRKIIEYLFQFPIKLSFESSLFSSTDACAFKIMILNQRTLRTLCDILSLTNSTLLTVDNFLQCIKKSYSQRMIFVSFSIKKYNALLLPCLLFSHFTSCTPTKSNLFLANSLFAAVREPDLYSLLTFHVPNFMFLSHRLGRTKG